MRLQNAKDIIHFDFRSAGRNF